MTRLYISTILFGYLLLPSLLLADGTRVSGDVTLDGDSAAGQVSRITIFGKEDRNVLGTGSVRKGQYAIVIRGDLPSSAVVQSYDDKWIGTSTKTLVGQATPQRTEEGSREFRADIELKPVSLVSKLIRVMTPGRRPIKSRRVQCKVVITALAGSKMNFRRFWNTETLPDGAARISVPNEGSGYVELKMDTFSREGIGYEGKKRFSFEDIRTRQDALVWFVEEKHAALIVQFKWDPAFSKEPFAPVPGRALDQHTVMFKGPTSRWQAMWPDGKVVAFDLKPGRYSLDLKKISNPYYTITKKPKVITIPKDSASPVKVEVWLRPVKLIRLAGRVVDATSGKPVASAQIRYGASPAKTNDKGRFYVKGPDLKDEVLIVQHPEYKPLTVSTPMKSSDMGTIRLTPLPTFSGTVVTKGTKKGIPYARLSIESEGMPRRSIRVIADKDGRFTKRIPGGSYRIKLQGRFAPKRDPRKPVTTTRSPKVDLWQGRIVVGPKGLEKDFEVEGMGQVVVSLKGVGARPKSAKGTVDPSSAPERPLIFLLVNPSDQKMVCVGQNQRGRRPGISPNAEVSLAASPGKYDIIIATSEIQGQAVGSIEIKAGQSSDLEVALGAWKKMSVEKGTRIIKLAD